MKTIGIRKFAWRANFAWLLLCAVPLFAALFGSIRVEIRDPQGMLVPSAEVTVRSKTSDWVKKVMTDAQGQLLVEVVPIGQYTISATATGFRYMPAKDLVVNSDTVTTIEIAMDMESVEQSVEVTGTMTAIAPESSTTETLTGKRDIERSPDADRTGSMAMITNNVPGTYVMHDHLHSRGGHGVAWEVDGVPIPNSNLATVGSQFDPKDVDYLESQRGGYSAEFGDRSYGVFNVVPRTGFEGERFADFYATYGSFNQTNEYLDFGSHTDRFAYFGSVAGSRTDYGLERPSVEILHDQSAAFSGFTSLMFTPDAKDQLRFVASYRGEHYQVPNIPDQQYVLGLRDTEDADDSFANFSWVRNPSTGLLITVSPYYHYNREHYLGGPHDLPVSAEDDHTANYVGGSINMQVTKGEHSLRFGTDSYGEHDSTLFGVKANDGTNLSLTQVQTLWAGVLGLYAQDSYKVLPWLTVNGGLRYTRFEGGLTEDALSPRVGTAIKLPKTRAVLRASYGRYYQHPPLNTVSGPLLDYAAKQGFGFLPIQGERDEIWEIGLGIPIHNWTLDFDHFHSNASNVIDHEVLGNSNLLFPVSIPRGRIHAWESTLRSPMIKRRVQFHWALSNQTAQVRGAVTGGLTDFIPATTGYYYMDHDQRVTLASGFDANAPKKLWISGNVLYGSGFLLANGPAHMPQHVTFDLSLGKDIRENLSVRFSVLNLFNNEFLTGFDSAFAGTHYDRPREFVAQIKYRFHF